MEVETKYIAPEREAFFRLSEAPSIAGYHLEPMPSMHVHDTYLDTADGALLRNGFVLRVRQQAESTLATIKNVSEGDGAFHRRIELEVELPSPEAIDDPPAGPFRSHLMELTDGDELHEIVGLHQRRTPRAAYDGARLVGLLSLDIVHSETMVERPSYEVEFELTDDGREDDLYRIDPILRTGGLKPESKSKFERAFLAAQRQLGAQLRVLPDERVQLQRMQEEGTPLHRRSARVVLMAADGLKSTTIANKVGLSPGRVEHWMHQFMERRLGIFEDALETQPLLSLASRPHFRIFELVNEVGDFPRLFPKPQEAEEFDPADWTVERYRTASGDGVVGPPELIPEEHVLADINQVEAAVPVGADSTGPPSIQARYPEEASDLIEKGYDTPSDVLLEGTTHEVISSVGEVGAPSLRDEKIQAGPREFKRTSNMAPERPLLQSGESVLSAAERTLRYQFARFLAAAEAVCMDEAAPARVRKALISAHRIRIGLELFEGHLSKRPARVLHKDLARVARAFDKLGNIDHVIAHLEAVLGETHDDSRSPVLQALGDQKALRRTQHHLVVELLAQPA
ncbi:MAG: CYTH domain-containing protein, partial [Rubricoccaceae bacterium]|nr:CYTH domain-containing protein [Rubricoccaceae bacterium]